MALTAPTNDLTGNTIASTYDQLLIIDHADGIVEATLGTVSTQIGKSALSISDEHILIKGVDTNNAAGFEVQQTDGTSILKIAADTPAATLIGALTVGVDGTGHDVIFYGDSPSSNMTWDQNGNTDGQLILNDARLFIDQDENGEALYIDTEASGNYGISVSGKYGIQVTQDLSGGLGAYFARNIAEAGTYALVTIIDDHASNTQPALKIQQDGAGYGIYIDQNGNASALYIDSESTTAVASLDIRADALTTGRIAYFNSNSVDTSTRNLVSIVNDDYRATGATCLNLRQDSGGSAIKATSVLGYMNTGAGAGFVEITHTGNSSSNTNNLLFIKNDDASSIGTTGIYVQQDSTSPAISATGGIVEQGGVLKENLLTNSGFDVWSNSTLENVGSDLITNGTMEADSNWADYGTVAGSGNVRSSTQAHAGTYSRKLITGDGNDGIQSDTFTTVTGKLYELKFWIYTASDTDISIAIRNGANDAWNLDAVTSGITTGSWQEITKVYEESSGGSGAYVVFYNGTGSVTQYFDDVTLYEVTPGCVAATEAAPDGWGKGTTHNGLDIWRQHNDANTEAVSKLGSFYALKIIYNRSSTDGGASGIAWPGPLQPASAGSGATRPVHLNRFRGRTVTFGCWVRSSTAAKASIALYDTDGNTTTSTAGTGWEWLEVTRTIADDTATFYADLSSVRHSSGTYISYFSQPMLVFGSSIGEGNYTRPQGEVIFTEKRMYMGDDGYSFGLSKSGYGTVAATTHNIETESLGKVPKGAKAVYATLAVQDSHDTDTGSLRFLSPDNNVLIRIDTTGGGSNVYQYWTGWIPCDTNGDIVYSIAASGSDTLDLTFTMGGVMLR